MSLFNKGRRTESPFISGANRVIYFLGTFNLPTPLAQLPLHFTIEHSHAHMHSHSIHTHTHINQVFYYQSLCNYLAHRVTYYSRSHLASILLRSLGLSGFNIIGVIDINKVIYLVSRQRHHGYMRIRLGFLCCERSLGNSRGTKLI